MFVQPQPVQPDSWKFTIHTGKLEAYTANCGDLTLEFPAGCRLEYPAGCVPSDVECTVRRIGRDGELADWGDAFVRERLTSWADVCSDIWVLEPHGLKFALHALPTLSLRLDATSSTQTFVRLESTYPLVPLSSHWEPVSGDFSFVSTGRVDLSSFSCYALACCAVDCFVWTEKVSAEATNASMFFGAFKSSEGLQAAYGSMHRDCLQSVGVDGMQNYHAHAMKSNGATPLILASGVTYALKFPRNDFALEDASLSLLWKHLASDTKSVLHGPLTLQLAPETTFAQLPGFDRGELKLLAKLIRSEKPDIRPCHRTLLEQTRLPPRLVDWTGDHVRLFFSAYPDAHEYRPEALRRTGDVLKELTNGQRLMKTPKLVAYLMSESETLTETDAQIAVEDLSHFVHHEHSVTIVIRSRSLPVDDHELLFEVWTADGSERIKDAFSIASESFEALEQRLTSRDLGYRKPTVQYLHGRTGEKRALGTDIELEQAILSYRGVPGRAVKLIVSSACFRVAVHYGFDRDQCDELQDIQGLLLEANGYEVRPHPNCESLDALSARILHFATHGDRNLGILELINGHPRFLVSTELIEKLTARRVKPECIVLNICASDEYARVLIDNGAQVGLRCIIYWVKEILEAILARDFTFAFYRGLTQCTNMIHDYRGAFEFAKAQMKELSRIGRRSYSVDDIECLQFRWFEALLAPSSEVESDATRSWKLMPPGSDNIFPSHLSTPLEDRDFSGLAGEHEKQTLRAIGFTVQMNGCDIGPGNGVKGSQHLPTAMRTLWHVNGESPPCPFCRTPSETPRYSDIWWDSHVGVSEVVQRASANLKAKLIGAPALATAKDHLREAVYCRKMDIWKFEMALRAILKLAVAGSITPQELTITKQAMTAPLTTAYSLGFADWAIDELATKCAAEAHRVFGLQGSLVVGQRVKVVCSSGCLECVEQTALPPAKRPCPGLSPGNSCPCTVKPLSSQCVSMSTIAALFTRPHHAYQGSSSDATTQCQFYINSSYAPSGIDVYCSSGGVGCVAGQRLLVKCDPTVDAASEWKGCIRVELGQDAVFDKHSVGVFFFSRVDIWLMQLL